MVSAASIALYCASAFFGNIAFSAMGFGMGICFLFVYQLGVLGGIMGDFGLKHAVFIQNIAILVVQPLVLWRAGLKQNLRLDMMITMVPMQLLATPIGQVLQDYTPAEILKIVVGVITISVAVWQIWNIWKGSRAEEVNKTPPTTTPAAVEGDTVITNKNITIEMTETPPPVKTKDVEQAADTELSWLHKVRAVFYPLQGAIIGMIVFAFLSGFTGGLIGVRGPPLIIFFFIWEYAKPEVRANGTVIATANTMVRIITYMVKSTPDEYPYDSWFVMDDIYLYLAVAVTSLIAAPVGLYLTRYLNRSGYKIALTMLLIINGITMITTATIDLIADNKDV
eukprot:sb/3466498/